MQLKREPDNEYDDYAIAVYLNEIKLGYLPAESNEIITKLIDTQLLDIMAELTHLQMQAQRWENVAIAVYALKEKPLLQAGSEVLPHTTLFEPEYVTIQLHNGTVTRMYYDDYDETAYGD
ncbi:MAG: HIRAN domain-containing protein [Bacteroidia bacterium]|nr:HIRAN domain-containing protein [Bacteroidia bacterium]